MNQRESQVGLDDAVRGQQVLHFLQLLLALPGGGIVLTAHRQVLEELQGADGCACRRQIARVVHLNAASGDWSRLDDDGRPHLGPSETASETQSVPWS